MKKNKQPWEDWWKSKKILSNELLKNAQVNNT